MLISTLRCALLTLGLSILVLAQVGPVTAAPVVTGVSPATGPVGTVVNVTGTALADATGVTFNGPVTVTPTAVTATSVRAVVPAGALTGPVAVTTPAGTATSAAVFRVAPKITGFAPASGIAGESITIAGFNLQIGDVPPTVRVGTVAAVVTAATATAVTFTIPPTALTGRLTVVTADGTATSATDLQVIRVPTVTALAPAAAPVGTTVTVSGTNLAAVTAVAFNGTAATTLTVLSNTSLRTAVPSGATSGPLTVTNRAGTAQSVAPFRVLPKISGFAPASGIAGESITIAGFNLELGDVPPTVRVGAVTAVVTEVTATAVTFTIPAAALTGRLTVLTADGTATSATDLQVIRVPTVTALAPAAAPVGTVVTVSGTNLAAVTALAFNGTAATTLTVLSNTSLRTTVPPGATSGPLAVTNRAGSGQSVAPFKVVPKITGFAPATGIAGESITITGLNLKVGDAPPTVRVGAVAGLVTEATATSVAFTIPASAATARLTVLTADGTATSATDLQVIRLPTVTALAPAGAPVGATVTVSGMNLAAVTAVTFDGVAAAAVTVLSNTSLRATVPVAATTGRIAVTNRAGRGLSAGLFRVAPKLTGFTPQIAIPGESVTLAGFNLKAGDTPPTVRVGPLAALVTGATPTSVTFAIPLTAASGLISLLTADGTATSATGLVVIRPPTVSGFTPAGAPVGTTVTVSGTNLGAVTGVTFNGTAAASLTLISHTSLRAVVPAGASTGRIAVTNRSGSAQSAGTFRVAPLITGFVPPGAVPGERVTVSGLNLQAGAGVPMVRVGTIAAVVAEATLTTVTFSVPPTAKNGRIGVTTSDGAALSAVDLVVLSPTGPQPQAFDPAAAPAGATIVVAGAGLSLSSEVEFAGSVKATPTAATATSLRVVVPAGAQSGPVTVTNPRGTGTSTTAFRVLPRITSVTPPGGVAGTPITITGTSLKVGGGHPQVRIGGLPAPVQSSSPTAVVATIPNGAVTSRVTVTTADGTATSPGVLLVTLPPVVESKLEKTTTRAGTTVERVVDVRFRPGPGDFHSVTVSDGVLFTDTPLVLRAEMVAGGRVVEDFGLRRVLGESEAYPPASRQFTIVAVPAGGGEPFVFQTTPQTLGADEQLTIFDLDNPRITNTPRILTPVLPGAPTVVGLVEESPGTVIQLLGCLGAGCTFTPLGMSVLSGPFWTVAIPAALAPGDRLKARAAAPGKLASVDSAILTIVATGQLATPTVLEPIAAGATSVFGFVEPGNSVEVFVRTPVETSLGFAAVSSSVWALEGVPALPPGLEVYAIARRTGFADSPPSEPVVVAAPARIASFDFSAVRNVPLTATWDTDGITAPLALLRLFASIANADETFVCEDQQDADAQAPPLFSSVEVVLPLECVGTAGAQATARGRICVSAIDIAGRQTSHCLVFD